MYESPSNARQSSLSWDLETMLDPELVEFRHRIGEEGMELILQESIRVNLQLEDKKEED